MGEKEFFESAKPWITGRVYLKGVLVTSDETTFEATVDHVSTVPPPNAFWIARVFDPALNFEWSTGVTFQVDQITTHNRIGYKALQQALSSTANEPPNDEFWRRISWAPTVEYSPLTKDKVQYWINALGGAKHAATDNRRTAIITPDVVVKDDNHPRTWVDTIQISDLNIPSELLVNGDTPMDTLRNLCMDVATGLPAGADAFSGNDRNGVPFAGNIAEYVSADGPGNGEWVVAGLGVGNTTVLVDDQEIYDYYDGLSWVRGPEGNTTGVWLKGAYFMIGNQTSFQADEQFECVHPVGFDTGASPSPRIDMGNTQLLPDDTDTSGTSAIFVVTNKPGIVSGLVVRDRLCGFNFAFPWPRTSNGIPYQVGTEPVIGERIEIEQFDMENMHLNHERKREWFGPNVEDYFPIQGFEFMEQFEHLEALLLGTKALVGDYGMALWIADRRDNTWIIDYVHKHNVVTEGKTASFGNRKVYRAVPGVGTFIPALQPEVLDIVDPRSIVRGGIFTKDSYDSQNRFVSLNRFTTSTQLKLSLDSFRMTKPLVATNVEEPNAKPDRNIEPQKLLFEKMVSYSQIKNYVLAMSQILGFRTDRYEIETPGRGTIAFGDPVKYFDPESINDTLTDTSGTFPNTVKATATKIMYSISKTPDGPGGFTRTVQLTTRLYPE